MNSGAFDSSSGSTCECGGELKLAACSRVAGWYQSLRLSGRNKWDRGSEWGGGVREAIVASTDNPMQHLEQSSNTTIMSWPSLPHADISDSSNNSISHTFPPCLLHPIPLLRWKDMVTCINMWRSVDQFSVHSHINFSQEIKRASIWCAFTSLILGSNHNPNT